MENDRRIETACGTLHEELCRRLLANSDWHTIQFLRQHVALGHVELNGSVCREPGSVLREGDTVSVGRTWLGPEQSWQVRRPTVWDRARSQFEDDG